MSSRRQSGSSVRLTLLTLLAGVAGAAWPRPADACLNGVLLDTREQTRLVARAERDLTAGRPARALVWLRGGPHVSCDDQLSIKSCSIVDGTAALVEDKSLARRWALVTAVATLRTRRGVAERMARHLLYLKGLAGDAPYIQARLAEALTRVLGAKPQAMDLLADLERRDLMPDADGYALLARLRWLKGDMSGSERARARCRQMDPASATCPA